MIEIVSNYISEAPISELKEIIRLCETLIELKTTFHDVNIRVSSEAPKEYPKINHYEYLGNCKLEHIEKPFHLYRDGNSVVFFLRAPKCFLPGEENKSI